jgi:hypothetical protein
MVPPMPNEPVSTSMSPFIPKSGPKEFLRIQYFSPWLVSDSPHPRRTEAWFGTILELKPAPPPSPLKTPLL